MLLVVAAATNFTGGHRMSFAGFRRLRSGSFTVNNGIFAHTERVFSA